MPFLTIDVALLLPSRLRATAVAAGELLADRMADRGQASAFRLDQPFPGLAGGICEPHVSLFMLRLEEPRIGLLLDALDPVAKRLLPVAARGKEWRHNPQGAPELHFHSSPEWVRLQRAVVATAEPLREGLRDADPSGAAPAQTIKRLQQQDPGSSQLDQLIHYGYDEITDDVADRFSPHITVAWPELPFDVDLHGLPAAADCGGKLVELAVFGMGPNGTCIRLFKTFALESTPIHQ
jgi:hypothetical protein